MTRTAVVTGASGFVGGRLAAALTRDGWHVRAVSRTPSAGPWAEHHRLDLACDEIPPDLLDGAEVVFHAAGKAHAVAEVSETDADYFAVNVRGTEVLLSATRAAQVPRFVYFSSVKAVGDAVVAPLSPADESFPAPADTPYGRSKRAAEHLVLAATEHSAMHACVLRPTLVYGPGVKGNLERMLAAVDANRFPPLPEVGNVRTMVGVDDLVAAARLAAEHPAARGRTYIVTDGRTYSTRQMYVAMCRALGRPVPWWSVPVSALTVAARVGDVVGALRGRRFPLDSTALTRLVDSAWYSSARIERELGFAAARTLYSTLPDMVEAYRASSEPDAAATSEEGSPDREGAAAKVA